MAATLAGMGRCAVLASLSVAVAAWIRACAAGRAAFFCFGVPGPFRSWGRARSAVASSASAATTVLLAPIRAGFLTLRVSGLFRDIFPGLAQLFEAAAAALAKCGEIPEENPYCARESRVFGPRPGNYGLGLGAALEDYAPEGRDEAGEAWLAASEWAIDAGGLSRRDRAGLEARVLAADGFVHVQDLVETDLLLAADYAAHEGGFAAAVARLGGHAPTLYHLDATHPDAPRARTLPEELARVVRARAANPAWASGMMRHGFRGAAEIAATLDNLAAFAHLTRDVPGHLFDLYHDATLGRPELVDFMRRDNPSALTAMRNRFGALRDAGLWVTRRNSIAAAIAGAHG